MTTRAPLLLAPKASALPAPPAPINTTVVPDRGDGCDALPLMFAYPVMFFIHEELVGYKMAKGPFII